MRNRLFVIMIGLLALTFCNFNATTIYAAVGDGISLHESEVNLKDPQAVKEFVGSKRVLDLEDKAKHLTISGDVRFEWQHLTEKARGKRLRGPSCLSCDNLPVSTNDFDAEANLKIDYEYGAAWAAIHWQFDNSAGVSNVDCCCLPNVKETSKFCSLDRFHGSGRGNELSLKRAYVGYTAYDKCGTIDFEVGRRKLYDVFESDIEFLSRFDGIVLHYYDDKVDWADEWGIKLAAFVVDERVNHYSWATEFDFINVWDSGLDIKYSFIDWTHRGRSRCTNKKPFGFDFRNSQLLLDYTLPTGWSLRTDVYAAFLVNHSAKQFRREFNKFKAKLNEARTDKKTSWEGFAGYTGVLFGQVREAGDWSVEIEYQYVQPNAIPYDDESGIGLGNLFDNCCLTRKCHPLARGYHGWEIEALYALTNNLTVSLIIDSSRSLHEQRHSYSKFELETIYAF